MPGLYVVGESSCTGVHGANRLASNSLLECLVFGNRCAAHIGAAGRGEPGEPDYAPESGCECDRVRINDYRERTRKVMSDDGGIIRNGKNLQSGDPPPEHIIDNLSRRQLQNLHHIEVLNMATTALPYCRAHMRARRASAHIQGVTETMIKALLYDEIVKLALKEDIGTGDITTASDLHRPQRISRASLSPRTICGLFVAARFGWSTVDRVPAPGVEGDTPPRPAGRSRARQGAISGPRSAPRSTDAAVCGVANYGGQIQGGARLRACPSPTPARPCGACACSEKYAARGGRVQQPPLQPLRRRAD